MRLDLDHAAVLVTGGTRGLGLAIGLALARHGARAWLTHRWASADEDEIRRLFAAGGAPEPRIVEADVANDDDAEVLLDRIAAEHSGVDVFVSNVCVASRGGSLDALSRRDLLTSLRYSAWPTLVYANAIEQRFGKLPDTIIATSSDGPDHHYPGYDYVASSKAALEASCADIARRTEGTATRSFVLRTRQVDTASFAAIFPSEAQELVANFEHFAISPADAGNAAVALVSGLLDGLHGQVLSVDKGATFMDNVMTAGPLLQGGLS